jgi:hypothetical protein
LWRDANLDQERRWGKIGCGQDLVFAAATLDQPDEGLLADRGLRVITASGETLRCRDMVRAARALTGKMQIDLAREAGGVAHRRQSDRNRPRPTLAETLDKIEQALRGWGVICFDQEGRRRGVRFRD